jgi:hypothetical protein
MGRCKTKDCKTPTVAGMGLCRDCQRKKPIIEEPRLLVFKEKHGERNFYIPDDATLFKAALKVLTDRFKEGYWYYKPEDPPKAPDFTKEQVASMPESMRADATKKLMKHAEAMRYYVREVEDYNDAVKAVNTKDGRLAWQSLRNSSGGEYQGCSLERLESAEPDED